MSKFETLKEKILISLPKITSRKDQEALEIAKEMHELSKEDILKCWALVQPSTKALFAIHPYVEILMINLSLGRPHPTWEQSLANFRRTDQELDKYSKD